MKRQLLSGIFAGVIATSSVSAENLPNSGMQHNIGGFVENTVFEVGSKPGQPRPPVIFDEADLTIIPKPGQPRPPTHISVDGTYSIGVRPRTPIPPTLMDEEHRLAVGSRPRPPRPPLAVS